MFTQVMGRFLVTGIFSFGISCFSSAYAQSTAEVNSKIDVDVEAGELVILKFVSHFFSKQPTISKNLIIYNTFKIFIHSKL